MRIADVPISIKLPDQLHWVDSPSGISQVVLHGDPDKPGLYIVLATWHALASEKSGDKKDGEGVSAKLLEKAIKDLGIDPEKRNPATS